MIQTPIYRILLAGVVSWCLAILAVPLLAASDSSLAQAAGGFLKECFGRVCHQIPDRSFHLAGEPLGVCIRCTSIYAGFLLGSFLLPLLVRRLTSRISARWILLGAAVPTAADAMLNLLGLVTSSELMRMLTGGLLGCALAFVLVPLMTRAWSPAVHRFLTKDNVVWMHDHPNSV